MKASRFSFSSVVTPLFILTTFLLPAPSSALQLYARAGRTSSNAVANHADSLNAATTASGASTAADSGESVGAAKKGLYGPSGERGSGLSGKVFVRFVLPEDWISLASLPSSDVSAALASLPSSDVSAASIQATPASTGAETVFTMRSFGQKVRAWLNGYRLGYWPAEKGR
jgi:hypothetical protein